MEYSLRSTMISTRSLSFSYDDSAKILDRFSVTIEGQHPVAMMGNSGCGKTTLLRLIAGLEEPSGGAVFVKGSREPSSVFYSFQDFDAFPWLTVAQNIAFVDRYDRHGSTFSAQQVLNSVGLYEHATKYPRELSGGMRKRLALGRAIANGADILLLDEPFASLDVCAKGDLHELLFALCDTKPVLPLVVTHDVDEAVFLAERILVCSGPPLRISDDIQVDLPYPRTLQSREDPRFEAAFLAVQRAFIKVRASTSRHPAADKMFGDSGS